MSLTIEQAIAEQAHAWLLVDYDAGEVLAAHDDREAVEHTRHAIGRGMVVERNSAAFLHAVSRFAEHSRFGETLIDTIRRRRRLCDT